MGEQADGKDSIARQVASELHWPELRALILVVSETAVEQRASWAELGARGGRRDLLLELAVGMRKTTLGGAFRNDSNVARGLLV